MKPGERDNLLIELKTDIKYISQSLDEIKVHQTIQNKGIEKALCVSNANTSWRKAFMWIVGVVVAVFSALLARGQGS